MKKKATYDDYLSELIKGFSTFQDTLEMMIDNVKYYKESETIQSYVKVKSAVISRLVEEFKENLK